MTAMTMRESLVAPSRYATSRGALTGEQVQRKEKVATASTATPEVDAIARLDRVQSLLTVEGEARRLFELAKRVERSAGFEPGMDNAFRDGVHAFLQGGGGDALAAIKRRLPLQSPTVQAATILYVGDADAPATSAERLALVVWYLDSEYPEVRDAAGLALIDLDDVRATPFLATAIDKEPLRSLRESLEQARSYLKRRR
jgi:hypothetical protein